MLGNKVLQHQVHGIKAEESSPLDALYLDFFFPISLARNIQLESFSIPTTLAISELERPILGNRQLGSIILVMLQCDC